MAEGRLARRIEDLLRVPDPPAAPWGDPGSVEVFRPSRGFLRYKIVSWVVKESWAIGFMVVTLFFSEWIPDFRFLRWLTADWLRTLEWLSLLALPLILPPTLFFVFLDYRNRWYVLTDRSLRLREGVWTVREMTISLANVQNVSTTQGPIQRFFGIANVDVATAGGGEIELGETESMHRGVLRGVADAGAVRDRIARSWKQARDQHLRPAESTIPPPAEGMTAAAPLLSAARALAAEASALRQSVLDSMEAPGF